ncbi:MAG TPA: aldehyde dehydrogenase, partial [Alcanivorax sp.]|nr:aldehyde dehydrogenase [Alcanivorax sp.]HBT06761.1 aldehyde dehydrogenase [Alcanivorax sp.]HCQ36041.1 aldehyde dehydrogenase [Alcanivorax sp.]HCR78465.1 aldehyde dehydrogenase [Alcanivorax sp.]
MSDDKVTKVLNALIETCRDGEEGFRTCAEQMEKPEL